MIENNEDVSKVLTSKITSMNPLFYIRGRGQTNDVFNQDISHWDVSNVTDFTSMFEGIEGLNVDISKWDVSSATKMTRMILQATDFI